MHKIKINLLIIFILSIVTGQGIQVGLKEGKSTAAVLTFEGSGITIQEAQVLTQKLESELIQIMEEQGLQDSSCTSQECAAKIGNILGVQKMVTASFGKIEDTYTIEARLFTVESGETEKIVSKTYKGEGDSLQTQIQIIGWELVGLEPPFDLLVAAGLETLEEVKEKSNKKVRSKWLRRTLILLVLAGGGYAAMQAGGDADIPEPPDLPSSGIFLVGGGK
jgi:hypothetical protein